MRTFRQCAFVLWILASASATAAPAPITISCPKELTPAAIQVHAGNGWRSFVAYPLPLYSAGMSAGPPEALAQLRGVDLQRKGEPDKTRYEFSGVGFEDGKWLDCNYGAAGEVSISRRLDDAVRSCIVAHTRKKREEKERVLVTCE